MQMTHHQARVRAVFHHGSDFRAKIERLAIASVNLQTNMHARLGALK